LHSLFFTIILKKEEKVLSVEVKRGTPVTPNKLFLKLIDEIEKPKKGKGKIREDSFHRR
jgi:hypothetical protein